MGTAFFQNLSRRLLKPSILAPLSLALIWVIALVFRLSDLAGRDLWTDEAWVALAVLQDSAAAALTAGQSTPPFYVLTVWAAAKLLGSQEWVLRSLSFAFGVGTLAIIWRLARVLTSRPVSLLALAVVACSPIMVYYSKELKQYSGDAFFAVLVFYLAERLRTSDGRRGWTALALAGLIGLGFSHTLVFCLPAAGLILWLSLPAARVRLALLGGFWIVAFGAYYLLFFRHAMDPFLLEYWAQDFPDFSGPGPFFIWLGSALYRYFWYFMGEWGPIWGPPFLLAGAYALWRGGQARGLVYWGLPILMAFGAAALHRYPFMAHYGGNRLMLFSAPMFYLLVTAGACLVFSWLWQQRQRWLAAVLAGAIFFTMNLWNLPGENLRSLMNREEISPLVARLEQELQPRDVVYVYHFAKWPFDYYYRGPALRLYYGQSCVETGLKPDLAGNTGRLWLIAAHIPPVEDMRNFAGGLLGPGWQEIACYPAEGAVLFCFQGPGATVAAKRPERRSGPPQSAAATPPDEKACK